MIEFKFIFVAGVIAVSDEDKFIFVICVIMIWISFELMIYDFEKDKIVSKS